MKNLKDKVDQIAKNLSKYKFVLGVVDSNSKRKRNKNQDEITNSEILELHELGSPLKKIPARPILGYTINHSYIDNLINEVIGDYINLCLIDKENEAERELMRTAMRIESFIRKSLRSGDHNLKPLSSYTISKKKSDLPLIDTGQLAKSIVCIVKRK